MTLELKGFLGKVESWKGLAACLHRGCRGEEMAISSSNPRGEILRRIETLSFISAGYVTCTRAT